MTRLRDPYSLFGLRNYPMNIALKSEDFLARLASGLDARGLVTDPADMAPHLVDWRGLFRGEALAVVRPRTAQEVAGVVAACAQAGVGIVPQGGNTSLAGGSVPAGEGPQIVLSLSRLNAIRTVDKVGMLIEVEAGCVLQTAQQAAAAAGRLLPVSLGAEGTAEIGGIISTNAGGINVLRYGMTRQLVLGLEVVLPDGTLINGLRHLRKDNAGYDWKQVFIGSEGTLGLVTAAVLRLVPAPRHKVTALLAVPSPEAALSLLARAQEEIGDQVSAFELICGLSFDLLARNCDLKAPLAAAPWVVLMQADSCLSGIEEAMESVLSGALEAGEATDGVVAASETQARQLWALREHITEAEQREGPSVKHDVSVPIADMPAFLAEAEAEVARALPGCRANMFGHLGDGNIHFNVLIADGTDKAAVNRTVHDVVAKYAGSISAEHGIGRYRAPELAHYKPQAELALMRRLKGALDPQGLMNRGKVLG